MYIYILKSPVLVKNNKNKHYLPYRTFVDRHHCLHCGSLLLRSFYRFRLDFLRIKENKKIRIGAQTSYGFKITLERKRSWSAMSLPPQIP